MKRPRRAPVMTLQALEHWFDHATPPPPCGGVSTLNGFLTGLAAGPVFLTPNDWMWHVVGDHEDRAVIGNKVQAVIDTVVDHYNLICRQLASPGHYSPLLMRTDEEEVLAQDWADGFFGAIQLRLDDWRPLFERQETGGPAMAILFHCSKPELKTLADELFPPPDLDLAESWRVIPEAVEDIYRYCKPMRFNADAPANDG